MASLDDWLIEDEEGNWVPVHEHQRGQDAHRRFRVIRYGKVTVDRTALIESPVTSWKTVDSNLSKQFHDEVSNLINLHSMYKTRCECRGVSPLSRGKFIFEKLMANGWSLKKGQFKLVRPLDV